MSSLWNVDENYYYYYYYGSTSELQITLILPFLSVASSFLLCFTFSFRSSRLIFVLCTVEATLHTLRMLRQRTAIIKTKPNHISLIRLIRLQSYRDPGLLGTPGPWVSLVRISQAIESKSEENVERSLLG